MSHTQHPAQQHPAQPGPSGVATQRPAMGMAQVEAAQPAPTAVAAPEMASYTIAAGYAAATLSQQMDAEGDNPAAVVKVRLVYAVDAAHLEPQVVACLISEFGLTQEEAEAIAGGGGASRREQRQEAREAAQARQEARQEDRQERVQEAAQARQAPPPQQRPGPPRPGMKA